MTPHQFRVFFQQAEHAFHTHWTKAVGTPNYDKALWRDLHNDLLRVWRDQATAIGIPKNQPLLPDEPSVR